MNFKDLISERILFGILIIGGYIALNVIVARGIVHDATALSFLHDSQTILGPLLGVMVNAIWKADRVDKANAATLAAAVEGLSVSTPVAPVPVAPAVAILNPGADSQQNGNQS